MSAHLATERLSAYLDDELAPREVERVEEHVLECQHCQRRLSGLRRVVDELHRMPSSGPPPVLARSVQIEVSSRWRARREEARGGRGLGSFELLQGPVRLGFAMVAGLAIMTFLWADWASREGGPTTRIVVPPAQDAGRAADRVEAGGRVFVEVRGAWWQEDLLGASDAQALQAVSMPAAAALAQAPWLSDVLARGPVVIQLDGEVVLVAPDPAPPQGPAASQGADAPQPPAGSTATTR